MAVSKKGGFKSTPKTEAKADSGHSHDELNAKIASLEKQVANLEGKLAGVLASVEAIAQVKNDLDALSSKYEAGKEKLGAEVKELKENAKSWATKQKEAMDSNKDGKVDFEEIYSYVFKRMRSRYNSEPRK
jgi:chromosome segregation ATPase